MASLQLFAALFALAAFSGCASALSGTHKSVRVTSVPPGALVRLDGTTRGITPTVIHPSTRSDHAVRVELAGYEPHDVELVRRHQVLVAANVVNGLFPGTAFDAATGAVWTFRPKAIHAELMPLGRGRARGISAKAQVP